MVTTSPALASTESDRQTFLAGGMVIVLAIALAKLLLHCYFNRSY